MTAVRAATISPIHSSDRYSSHSSDRYSSHSSDRYSSHSSDRSSSHSSDRYSSFLVVAVASLGDPLESRP